MAKRLILAWLLLLWPLFAWLPDKPFAAPIPQAMLRGQNFSSVVTGSVSFIALTAYTACVSGTNPCTSISYTLQNNNDDAMVMVEFCSNSSCNSPSSIASATFSDGANTFIQVSGCTQSFHFDVACFNANNVVAGTYTTATFNTSLGAGTFYYPVVYVVEVQGQNIIHPIDPAVSNSKQSSGTSFSLASAGNVTNAGEYVLALAFAGSTLTVTGSFSQIYGSGTQIALSNLIHPASGAGVTYTGTMSSAQYGAAMMATTP